MENRALLSWYWSMNSANNEGFDYFQLEAYLFHPGFFAKTLKKYLQLHLLCLGGSQFENSIGIALGLSGLVWSLDFSYP